MFKTVSFSFPWQRLFFCYYVCNGKLETSMETGALLSLHGELRWRKSACCSSLCTSVGPKQTQAPRSSPCVILSLNTLNPVLHTSDLTGKWSAYSPAMKIRAGKPFRDTTGRTVRQKRQTSSLGGRLRRMLMSFCSHELSLDRKS